MCCLSSKLQNICSCLAFLYILRFCVQPWSYYFVKCETMNLMLSMFGHLFNLQAFVKYNITYTLRYISSWHPSSIHCHKLWNKTFFKNAQRPMAQSVGFRYLSNSTMFSKDGPVHRLPRWQPLAGLGHVFSCLFNDMISEWPCNRVASRPWPD